LFLNLYRVCQINSPGTAKPYPGLRSETSSRKRIPGNGESIYSPLAAVSVFFSGTGASLAGDFDFTASLTSGFEVAVSLAAGAGAGLSFASGFDAGDLGASVPLVSDFGAGASLFCGFDAASVAGFCARVSACFSATG
jgi:hypothetical protein